MCSIEQQCDLKKAACDLKAASFILAVRIFAAFLVEYTTLICQVLPLRCKETGRIHQGSTPREKYSLSWLVTNSV